MKDDKLVALITAPTPEVGRQIARALVEGKLAACVNVLPPMRSIYAWEGQVIEEEETLLIVKTRADVFSEKLIPAVKAIHPYQVPEIIALPVQAGLEDYLCWIDGWVG